MKSILCVLMCILVTSCGMIDFRNKSLGLDTEVKGLDLSLPSLFTGDSIICIRLGIIHNRYISTPNSSEANVAELVKGLTIRNPTMAEEVGQIVSDITKK